MYGRDTDTGRRITFGGYNPVTMGLIVLNVVTYILLMSGVHGLAPLLAFQPENFPGFFWTAFTWPLLAQLEHPLSLVFSLCWTYMFIGSLERSWGSRDFGVFAFVLSILMAMSVWVGHFLVPGAALAGAGPITGAMMLAWMVINYREKITFWFVELPAPLIGLLGVLMTWYYAGAGLGGLFALTGCYAAYWYAKNGRYSTAGYSERKSFTFGLREKAETSSARFKNFDRETGGKRQFFNIFRWWRDRQEKKRLEDIFRRSGFTDDER